jgi:hypothetical protein
MQDYLTIDIESYQLYSNKVKYCCFVALSSLYGDLYLYLHFLCGKFMHWDKQINYFLKVLS